MFTPVQDRDQNLLFPNVAVPFPVRFPWSVTTLIQLQEAAKNFFIHHDPNSQQETSYRDSAIILNKEIGTIHAQSEPDTYL